jgi:type IV pilus assembly protein PilE
MKKGFTLLEVMVTIVIIGILGTLALPAYLRSLEITYDNQAKSDLKLLSRAEKGYYLDMTAYYVPSNATQPEINRELNSVLGLSLSGGTDRKWNFTGNAAGCVKATRNGSDSRIWHMNITDMEAYSGACP